MSKYAIIGAACRFPGASNLEDYWRLIIESKIVTTDPPENRSALSSAKTHPNFADKITTLKGGYIDDIDQFDAGYFGITPREAKTIDPQQRILLQLTRQALEDAGLTRRDMSNKTVGVYIGASSSDYRTLDSYQPDALTAYHAIGNANSILANRLSYFFDFKGPSLTIDTACSASLNAVHIAVNALRCGDVDIAIVGGVNAILSPELTVSFSQAKMLSPSGRCKSFAEDADGYGRSEGGGIVVLCRDVDAALNRYNCRAKICGSAANQDGRTNGIMAPNGLRQVEVIRDALKSARLTPEDIDYIETHGTGTVLGDAIEYKSLLAIFEDANPNLAFGSAKSNIGHLEAAAGLAGLLKAMLICEARTLPAHPVKPPYNPILHKHQKAGPKLLQDALEFKNGDLHIGVSAFGFGGANAHVIVEAVPQVATPGPKSETEAWVTFPISSHSKAALLEDAKQLARFLEKTATPNHLISQSLLHQRDPLRYRLCGVGPSREACLSDLQSSDIIEVLRRPKIAFIFTGQGSQRVGMGRDLYAKNSAFRKIYDALAEQIYLATSFNPIEILSETTTLTSECLRQNTHQTQLSLFCLELSLAELWMSAGVRPDYLIGHSLGEIVAHTVSGAITKTDAIRLVDKRGALMQSAPPGGAMLSISSDQPQTLFERLTRTYPNVELAALNSTRSLVLSGPSSDIGKIDAYLTAENITCRTLKTRHAFHSSQFEDAARELAVFEKTLALAPPEIPVFGNLDGQPVDLTQQQSYFSKLVTAPVMFAEGVKNAVLSGANIFIEIGPRPVLSSLITANAKVITPHPIASLASFHHREDESLALTKTAAKLWQYGGPFASFETAPSAEILPRLPPRSFETRRYWLDNNPAARAPASPEPRPKTADNSDVVAAQLSLIDSQIQLLSQYQRRPLI